MTKLYGTFINETCTRNDNIPSNLVNLVGSNGPLTNQNTPAKQEKKSWFGYNFRGGAPDPFLLNG